MPRTCTVCTHPEREQIDIELLEGRPFKDLAARFGPSGSALHRHGRSHLPERLLKAQAAAEVSKGDDLFAQLESLKVNARRILATAESHGDLRTALAGIRELSRLIELVAKLPAELKTRPTSAVNVELIDPITAEKMAEAYLEHRRKE